MVESGRSVAGRASNEGGTALSAFVRKRQSHAAMFLAPKTRPKPLVLPERLFRFIVRERWPAAGVAFDAEQPNARKKRDKSDCGRPQIT